MTDDNERDEAADTSAEDEPGDFPEVTEDEVKPEDIE